MTSFKTVNTDYTLTCNDGAGSFTVNAQTVFLGNVTYTVPAVSIAPFITVAANNTGLYSTMGLIGQTSANTYAGLRFNTTNSRWEVSNNVTSTGVAISAYTDVIQSPYGPPGTVQISGLTGQFVGSPTLSFDPVSNSLILNGSQYFEYTSQGNIVANTVSLYSNVASSGQTGLYFASTENTGELISESKAKLYSIIF